MKIRKILVFVGFFLNTVVYSQDLFSDHVFGLSKSIVIEDCNMNDDCMVLPSKDSKKVTTVGLKTNERVTYFFDSNYEMYKKRLKIHNLAYTTKILIERYPNLNVYQTKFWSNTQKVEIKEINGNNYLDVESKNFIPKF